jgi:hypothetical protein
MKNAESSPRPGRGLWRKMAEYSPRRGGLSRKNAKHDAAVWKIKKVVLQNLFCNTTLKSRLRAFPAVLFRARAKTS